MPSFNGAKTWRHNGKIHREDGPAYEGPFNKEWWICGNRHREDGPAIEWRDGTKEWWINGKYHGSIEPENWSHLVQLARVEIIMEN